MQRLWSQIAVFLVALPGAAPDLAAQGRLPERMSGTWTNEAPTQTGYRPRGGSWSVLITQQNPDGSIEGKVTWNGGLFCEMKGEPMTGRFDGPKLTLTVTFQNKMPNAGCSKEELLLDRTGEGNTFEGVRPPLPQILRLNPS